MSEAAAKKRPPMKAIGSMPCPCCVAMVPVKEQANGLAAVSCSWCGLQSYARGEQADRILRGKMKAIAPEAAPPAPSPKPADSPTAPPPKPAAKKSLLEDL